MDETTSAEVIGWREWVSLPDLGVEWVKGKIDTGARSSAIHAFDLEIYEVDDGHRARFVVRPWQRSDRDPVEVDVAVLEHRAVRSSNGATSERPIVRTTMRIGTIERPIDLTLARRDEMGFRLLVGREAVRPDFLVDPGRSYLAGRPPREIVRANRRLPRVR